MNRLTKTQTEKVDLETLQILAKCKILGYKDKCSKSSEDNIQKLEDAYFDKELLLKYFLKR